MCVSLDTSRWDDESPNPHPNPCDEQPVKPVALAPNTGGESFELIDRFAQVLGD